MPRLTPGTEVWLSLFWDLSSERQVGMAPGQIPASAIERLAYKLGIPEVSMFRACVRAMDSAYLAHASGSEGEKDVVVERDMSTGLFDALFG